jgi:anti-sigma B factor antagonist
VSFKVTDREVDGVTVLAIDGRIVIGEETNQLRERVKGMLAEGNKKIVLNMGTVTYIDSAGLGVLVALHNSATIQGASLNLCQLGSKFKELLQITKLVTVFDVDNTEADSIRSLSR